MKTEETPMNTTTRSSVARAATLALFLLAAASALANTYTVTNINDSGPGSLRPGGIVTSPNVLSGILISGSSNTIGGASPAVAPSSGKSQHLTSSDQVPAGLAKSDWQSIRAAYEAGRHAFQPVAGGWQARNPGQQWLTKFDGRGFVAEPKDGGWQWGLELKRYGFPGAERAVGGAPAVKAEGQRLTYDWDAAVQEWFVNDTRGLEHGFTVRERPDEIRNPKSETRNDLAFTLAVRGSLAALVTADGQGVQFRDAAGAAALTYAGLKVWDADGKILPSRFAPLDPRHPSLVTLWVEERGARYPLTIDPIAQQAYLKAGNTGASDQFGDSVAVSGDTVVVGATGEDSSTTGVNSTPNDVAINAGAAYVFTRSAGVWTQQAYLKAGNTGAGDNFGISVAVSGDTVVVGARQEDSSTTGVNSTPNESASDSGAAYVFTRSAGVWTQQAYLKAGNTGAFDFFGRSVAVSGDTVVVGALNEDSSTMGVNSTPNESAPDAGAAYVFARSAGVWTQQAYLKAGNTGVGDAFGYSVAVSGDTAVVGADDEDSSTTGVNSTPDESAPDAGAAYVFARSAGVWTQQAYLKAGNTGAGDNFGISVAVSVDTLVVGAYLEDS
ncbi:MAG: FG-GAP repeat protein, partial [Verrucomicrobiales bacterium]|nr:FG-GAP repeat protein [Verrucomicrobiales bacterium]